MKNKKMLYIILSVVAVILVAVIVVAAIKLNGAPAAGGQSGTDETTSAIAGTVDNADETNTEAASQSTENTETDNGKTGNDNVVKDPETTIEAVKDEITGIDFDDLLD